MHDYDFLGFASSLFLCFLFVIGTIEYNTMQYGICRAPLYKTSRSAIKSPDNSRKECRLSICKVVVVVLLHFV